MHLFNSRFFFFLNQPFDVFALTLVHSLTPEESSQVQELFLSGYWAFECLTVRDYNDMICGICGVAPKVEIAQRHRNDVLELKNVEVTDCLCHLQHTYNFSADSGRSCAFLLCSLPGRSVQSRMKFMWMTSG